MNICSTIACKCSHHFCHGNICIINFFVIATRLTEREKKDREHKKQLLQIAKEHEKARELERVQRYKMPQDMKKGEKGKQKHH